MPDRHRNIMPLQGRGVCAVVVDDEFAILVVRDDGLDGEDGTGRVLSRPPFMEYPDNDARVAFEVVATPQGRVLRYSCTLPETAT